MTRAVGAILRRSQSIGGAQAIEAWYHKTHPTAADLCGMLHRVEALLYAFSAIETASPTFIHRPVADSVLAASARVRVHVV